MKYVLSALLIFISTNLMASNYRLSGEWESTCNTWTVLKFETDGVEDYALFENLTFDDAGVNATVKATVNGTDHQVFWGDIYEDIPVLYYSDVNGVLYRGDVIANYYTDTTGSYVMNLSEVPIPATIWLFMGGIGMLFGFKQR